MSQMTQITAKKQPIERGTAKDKASRWLEFQAAKRFQI
jgi:hypothetical protein